MANDAPSRGLAVPAIIWNGSRYFTSLKVYDAGHIDCWGSGDLAEFRTNIADDWTTTTVPDGEQLSIHGLLDWTVRDGRWELDGPGLQARVEDIVADPRPRPWTRGWVVDGNPARADGEIGRLVHAFARADDGVWYVADLCGFADGTIDVVGLPVTRTLDRAGLAAAYDAGTLAQAVPDGATVAILGLGRYTSEVPGYRRVDPHDAEVLAELDGDSGADARHDFLAELDDAIDEAAGRPSSLDRCRAAYETYLAAPTGAHRDQVRITYEAIPSQNRMYVLRDQDRKDVPVRMVIYGRHELETWSHRAVARALGRDPLPHIDVPDPVDE